MNLGSIPKELVDSKQGLAKLTANVESIVFLMTIVDGIMYLSLFVMWLVPFDCTHSKSNLSTSLVSIC